MPNDAALPSLGLQVAHLAVKVFALQCALDLFSDLGLLRSESGEFDGDFGLDVRVERRLAGGVGRVGIGVRGRA